MIMKPWTSVGGNFAFMMDLSRIPQEKRMQVIQKLKDSQPRIIPMTIDRDGCACRLTEET